MNIRTALLGLKHGRLGKPMLFHRKGRPYDSKSNQYHYCHSYYQGLEERKKNGAKILDDIRRKNG